VASFYADENFPLEVVEALRRRGHDVLTAADAGQANQRIPDREVLDYARRDARILLTLNRWDFVRLHEQRTTHAGILACNADPEVERQATLIHDAVAAGSLEGQLVRINRPGRS
jgi:predicted nuclease of predicted toxin-antitoxin system